MSDDLNKVRNEYLNTVMKSSPNMNEGLSIRSPIGQAEASASQGELSERKRLFTLELVKHSMGSAWARESGYPTARDICGLAYCVVNELEKEGLL